MTDLHVKLTPLAIQQLSRSQEDYYQLMIAHGYLVAVPPLRRTWTPEKEAAIQRALDELL